MTHEIVQYVDLALYLAPLLFPIISAAIYKYQLTAGKDVPDIITKETGRGEVEAFSQIVGNEVFIAIPTGSKVIIEDDETTLVNDDIRQHEGRIKHIKPHFIIHKGKPRQGTTFLDRLDEKKIFKISEKIEIRYLGNIINERLKSSSLKNIFHNGIKF